MDRSAFAVSLASRLRSAGVPVGLTGIADFVRALAVHPPDSRTRLYWTARIALVRRHSELAVFDAVFTAVFDDALLSIDPAARRTALSRTMTDDDGFAGVAGKSDTEEAGSGLPWITLPPAVAAADGTDQALAVPQRLPSELAQLADVPFEQLSPEQLHQLGEWLRAVSRTWPTRRSRRVAVHPAGHQVALRPTLARSRRTGFEPIELVRVKAVDKPRRIVMLCDVSESMHAQASAYLQLMRALTLSADAEVFAFATTLTRLTTVLAHRSTQVALAQASEKVTDRFGGTRIATNLQALLSSHHGGLLRGAIVIVASDGWDSDPPEQLAAAMARLHRRAHRVIWINPRAGARGFEPRVATMAAALPFCDSLLPAHTFASLAQVIAEIGGGTSPGTAEPVSSRGSRGSRAGTGPR